MDVDRSGIEYLIPEKEFEGLPADEKKVSGYLYYLILTPGPVLAFAQV